MAAKRRRQTLSSENMTYWTYNVELIKRYKLDYQDQKVFLFFFVTDKVRNVITSSTQQVNALTADMKVIITFSFGWKIGKMQQCTGDDTVSRVLHIVALTPPKQQWSKVMCGIFFFFYDPTFH